MKMFKNGVYYGKKTYIYGMKLTIYYKRKYKVVLPYTGYTVYCNSIKTINMICKDHRDDDHPEEVLIYKNNKLIKTLYGLNMKCFLLDTYYSL